MNSSGSHQCVHGKQPCSRAAALGCRPCAPVTSPTKAKPKDSGSWGSSAWPWMAAPHVRAFHHTSSEDLQMPSLPCSTNCDYPAPMTRCPCCHQQSVCTISRHWCQPRALELRYWGITNSRRIQKHFGGVIPLPEKDCKREKVCRASQSTNRIISLLPC